MATLRQQLLELIDKLAPDVQKAFTESVDDIKSEIVLREVVERLERRDIEGAIQALHIQPSAFGRLGEAIRQAFNAGGSLVANAMPRLSDFLGARVVWRWNVSNQRAEANIRDLSSKLITNVTESTIEAARETIVSGYSQGQRLRFEDGLKRVPALGHDQQRLLQDIKVPDCCLKDLPAVLSPDGLVHQQRHSGVQEVIHLFIAQRFIGHGGDVADGR